MYPHTRMCPYAMRCDGRAGRAYQRADASVVEQQIGGIWASAAVGRAAAEDRRLPLPECDRPGELRQGAHPFLSSPSPLRSPSLARFYPPSLFFALFLCFCFEICSFVSFRFVRVYSTVELPSMLSARTPTVLGLQHTPTYCIVEGSYSNSTVLYCTRTRRLTSLIELCSLVCDDLLCVCGVFIKYSILVYVL